MKMLEAQNHYEILKIPFDADWKTIKEAYRQALELYAEDSLATHALFSEEQREDILQAIEEAFRTLMDPDLRAIHNQTLLASGQIDAALLTKPANKEAVTPSVDRPISAPAKQRDPDAWAKKKAKEEAIHSLIAEIMKKDQISGSDLKQLREAFGIDLSEIFAQTRIAKTMLEAIEENRFDDLPAEVFSRAFVKSYAKILQLDPQHVVEAYYRQNQSR